MRINKDLALTYNGYLNTAMYDYNSIDGQEATDLFQEFNNRIGLVYQSLPAFFILDYIKKSYLLVSGSVKMVTGYCAEGFLEGGLEKLLTIYHPADFKVLNNQIFAENISFLKQIPQQEHGQYIFSNQFRLRQPDNSFSNLLQTGSYITSKETGLPLYNLGMVVDITNFKKDEHYMSHYIEKVTDDGNAKSKSLMIRNYFCTSEELAAFTNHEKTVLKYMADGLSSKMIADKLKRSINTINNHRQNMLKKSNTKNVAQLITYASKNHII